MKLPPQLQQSPSKGNDSHLSKNSFVDWTLCYKPLWISPAELKFLTWQATTWCWHRHTRHRQNLLAVGKRRLDLPTWSTSKRWTRENWRGLQTLQESEASLLSGRPNAFISFRKTTSKSSQVSRLGNHGIFHIAQLFTMDMLNCACKL